MNSPSPSVPQQLPTLCPPPPANFPRLRIKAEPEDFVVEELPLYEPGGSGTHTYFWIEKRGLNSHDAVRRIAEVLGKRAADGGLAGLKDARAVSRQWISFEHVKEGLDKAAAIQDEKLRVLKVSSHGNKLKMGHLRGNRFIIRLRPIADCGLQIAYWQQPVLDRAIIVFETLSRKGIPNYFGEQRFGRGGNNAALGKLLVQGDVPGFEAAAKAAGVRFQDRKLRNLLVNAFQSELFNQILSRRMPDIGRIEAGDLACLHRNGAVFAVATAEDAQREQPRADAFEISPSGPLFGEKSILAEGRPGEIERDVLAASEVKAADFSRREAERQPGARRSLRIAFLEPPETSRDESGILLRFALPSGAYATVVLNEIMGQNNGQPVLD